MFTSGELSPQQAAALNELFRGYLAHGFELRPVAWPVFVRPAGKRGTFVGIDPKAFAPPPPDSGSAPAYTPPVGITNLCFYHWPSGALKGARFVVTDNETGESECVTAGTCPDPDGCDGESGSGGGDPGGAVAWGEITGTLADQTDLQAALDVLGEYPVLSYVQATGTSTTLNQANDVYQDVTGLSVTLPAAGTYLVLWDVRFTLNSTAADGNAYSKLVLNGSDVTDSERFGLFNGTVNTTFISASTGTMVVTAAGAHALKVQAARTTSGTWTLSLASSAASGRTHLTAVRIA